MHNLITCYVEHFASGLLYGFARALAYVARDLSFVACVFMQIFQTQSKLSQNRIRASIRTLSYNIATFTCTIIAWFI